ncbi:16S rRNA (guanine527-N7)-methyltransferase [Rhizomicrobium palustre]|uniref:Ribosomal RNA small subunit methyltransferase G n=1 Tax=Rhizomicrobium palustre TaxID=189966 RepID=A0A846MZ08_9PROT|nr:16S rRNA (guanine(527)-N(7))-methyltransferase RsmG [Rhizomicrobium palustre]NIK88190.1 16S rRNA (guanine527-N7)-methyltransferase [Rhizomicrobium palustre]
MSDPALPEAAAPNFGPEAFLAETGVSRETLELLSAYVEMLKEWNALHNLVAESTMGEVWHRHILDSAQLEPLIPAEAWTLVDLGSGAGFPGLVLAIMRRDRLMVTLYEATKKKADFLAAVAEKLKLPVTVKNCRIEAEPQQYFDVVTARAFAPMDALLGYAHRFVGPTTICLLLKGGKLEEELTAAERHWKMSLERHPSKTHPLGIVLELHDLKPARPAPAKARTATRKRRKP